MIERAASIRSCCSASRSSIAGEVLLGSADISCTTIARLWSGISIRRVGKVGRVAAIDSNEPLTVVNLPEAPHSFDLFYDTPLTRHVLQQGLRFLRVYLGT